jgi:hypothetical protein
MPWIWKSRRFSPRTGAPMCAGRPGRIHHPVHCKRTGRGWWLGHNLKRWTCPICGLAHFRS